MGNLQIRRTFFLAFISADYNRLQVMKLNKNYTVYYFFRGGGFTKIEQVRTRVEGRGGGYKFCSFYDNVKIECLQTCHFG